MTKRKKIVNKEDDLFYFGGHVPREVQDRLEPCKERGMTNQTIARKLAYLWLALPDEVQNQLYLSSIDADYSTEDKMISDLFKAVDRVLLGNILALIPDAASVAEAVASARQPKQAQRQKKSRRKPAG